MGKFIDLTNKKFGRLKAIKYLKNYKYLCICDCGKESVVRSCHLRNGHTKSCGCYDMEIKTKHNLSKNSIYNIYTTMMSRCFSEKSKGFKNYGKRNIFVCEEWKKDFKKFYEWSLENGYKPGLEIDRINNNLGYCSNNCRFVSRKQNMLNTSRSLFYFVNNKKYDSIDEAAKDNFVSKATISRWCKGRNDKNRNKVFPKNGCYVKKKYEIHN